MDACMRPSAAANTRFGDDDDDDDAESGFMRVLMRCECATVRGRRCELRVLAES